MDVSPTALDAAATRITADYPGAAGAQHRRRLHPAPQAPARPAGAGMVAFLGGTIGNLVPGRAGRVPGRRPLGPRAGRAPAARHRPGEEPAGGGARLRRRAGVTAEFNRNVLRVLNQQPGRRLRPRRLRPRGALGRRPRVDRDAAARPLADAGHHPGRRPGRRLRGRRGGPHRGVGEVPPRRRASGSWPTPVSPSTTGGPTGTACSPSPSPTPSTDDVSRALRRRGHRAAPLSDRNAPVGVTARVQTAADGDHHDDARPQSGQRRDLCSGFGSARASRSSTRHRS